MERILNNAILLLENQLITKHQHGFLRKRSTFTNLLECLQDWTVNLQLRKCTDVVYFDFKKAFDSVSHPKLLIKLKAYGLTGNLLRWITNFLLDRRQCVKLGDKVSEPVPVLSGVPQGSVLGPSLFLLFINDVSNIFDDLAVSFTLYADDIKLCSCYNVTSSGDTLSVAITRLCEWSDIWQLSIAVQKCFTCSICSYKSNAHSARRSYMINNTVLPSVNCIRDLGVIVDCHLKFDAHISLIVRKAMLRSRLILQCFSSRNKDLMMKAFFTYVRPILEYCSPVWSPHLKYLIDRIQSVQNFLPKDYQAYGTFHTLNVLNS